ncbi:MAG: DUF2851 family protein [Ignavibacteriae bacterium]|nr:DUF2851 family protein [Ignavibacteriota bacterium]
MTAPMSVPHSRPLQGATRLRRPAACRASACAEPPRHYAGMPEEHVCTLWEQRAGTGVVITSAEGREIRILCAGVKNPHEGPDYLGARIHVDGREEAGDIEVHVREGDWKRHGHGDDPRYRGVILHVVLLRERGLPGPVFAHTVVLPDILDRKLRTAWVSLLEVLPARAHPCADTAAYLHPSRREAALLLAAASRFARKNARIAARLGACSASRPVAEARMQVLYELFARACGYGGNESAMEALAASSPLTQFEGVYAEVFHALCARAEQFSIPAANGAPPDGHGGLVWHSRGVRPHNAVQRRLAQLAAYICALRDDSLYTALRHALCVAPAQLPALLESACTQSAAAAPGEGRRTEILVNVVAPFYAVTGAQDGNAALVQAAAALYFHTPGAASNHKTRALGYLCPAGEMLDSMTQQALVELHDTFCTAGRCASCLLSSP